jgi:hypothetical protein
MTSQARFPPPWQVEQTPGGFKVLDAIEDTAIGDSVGCG